MLTRTAPYRTLGIAGGSRRRRTQHQLLSTHSSRYLRRGWVVVGPGTPSSRCGGDPSVCLTRMDFSRGRPHGVDHIQTASHQPYTPIAEVADCRNSRDAKSKRSPHLCSPRHASSPTTRRPPYLYNLTPNPSTFLDDYPTTWPRIHQPPRRHQAARSG